MFPSLYAIISGDFGGRPALGWADCLAGAGVEIIQYRVKQLSSRELLSTSRELVELSRNKSFRMIVNDRADIAALAGAGGVHVGQQDIGVADARRVCGAECWVGVSTHTLEQVREAAGSVPLRFPEAAMTRVDCPFYLTGSTRHWRIPVTKFPQ